MSLDTIDEGSMVSTHENALDASRDSEREFGDERKERRDLWRPLSRTDEGHQSFLRTELAEMTTWVKQSESREWGVKPRSLHSRPLPPLPGEWPLAAFHFVSLGICR